MAEVKKEMMGVFKLQRKIPVLPKTNHTHPPALSEQKKPSKHTRSPTPHPCEAKQWAASPAQESSQSETKDKRKTS